jgi:hypothetical protein
MEVVKLGARSFAIGNQVAPDGEDGVIFWICWGFDHLCHVLILFAGGAAVKQPAPFRPRWASGWKA